MTTLTPLDPHTILSENSKWTKGRGSLLPYGSVTDFDANSITNPAVNSYAGQGYRCLYVGQNNGNTKNKEVVSQVGAAIKIMTTASPSWVKGNANPVISATNDQSSWDSLLIDFPCFFFNSYTHTWEYYYAGAPVTAPPGYPVPGVVTDFVGIGFAWSYNAPENGAAQKSGNNPIITRQMVATALGTQLANIGAILAPWVVLLPDGSRRMWFGCQLAPSWSFVVLHARLPPTTSLSPTAPDTGWTVDGASINPVFTWGASGSWYARETGVLRPTLIENVWLAVFDGSQEWTYSTQTGIAASYDGLNWMPWELPIIGLGAENAFDSRFASVASITPLYPTEGQGFYLLYWGNNSKQSNIGEARLIKSAVAIRTSALTTSFT